MLGSVMVRKQRRPLGPERQGGLLVGPALLLHQGDQFARHEGKGHEDRRQHDPRHREDDLDVVRASSQGPNRPWAPKTST